MAAKDEIRKIRIKKLRAIESAGFSVYPGTVKKTHSCKQALDDFSKLSKAKKEIILAGRIMSLRRHGGLVFSHIKDESGSIQASFKKNKLGLKNFLFFLNNLDAGDFIEIKGVLFKTKKGEKTIEAETYKCLVKSVLSLPEKWHGLKDTEERYRKRYLDLIFNPEVKEKFKLRSKIIREIRSILEKQGFLEVETPVLQPIYGGAKAKPFKTHLNAQNLDLYLRISLELYLKRLLVGGFEKIYEIGRCFRNEGVDRSHNPDFTMLEFYWAYADYKDLMKFTENFFSELLKNLFGKTKINYKGKEIDFKPPWPRVEFSHLLRKYAKINLDDIDVNALKKKAREFDLEAKGGKAEIADAIYKKYCRPKIWKPTFIIHHLSGAFPLAKKLEKDSSKTANFQLVVADTELVNAFSELNDPFEQKKRFEEQEKIRKQGFEEAQRMDKDFIEALEYGMPPSAGFGMGIDRLTALLTDSQSLREVILFPTMRPK